MNENINFYIYLAFFSTISLSATSLCGAASSSSAAGTPDRSDATHPLYALYDPQNSARVVTFQGVSPSVYYQAPTSYIGLCLGRTTKEPTCQITDQNTLILHGNYLYIHNQPLVVHYRMHPSIEAISMLVAGGLPKDDTATPWSYYPALPYIVLEAEKTLSSSARELIAQQAAFAGMASMAAIIEKLKTTSGEKPALIVDLRVWLQKYKGTHWHNELPVKRIHRPRPMYLGGFEASDALDYQDLTAAECASLKEKASKPARQETEVVDCCVQ